MKFWIAAATASVFTFGASPASASYIIRFEETSAGVLVIGSGSVDTSNLMLLATASLDFDLYPRLGIVTLGESRAADFYGLVQPSGANFGDGNIAKADISTGAKVGVGLSDGTIRLPVGYISRTDLGVSSSAFFGSTFSSLGVVPSDFSVRLGPSNDTIKVQFASSLPPSAVPEPTSWSMIILGLGLIGAALRYRRGSMVASAW